MIRKSMLLVASLAIATPVLTMPVLAKDKSADTEHTDKAKDPNRKVCRYEGETGSMMRKRICHTVAEWEALKAADADQARSMVDRMNRSRAAQVN